VVSEQAPTSAMAATALARLEPTNSVRIRAPDLS
jgi:hypothetical protein